MDIWRHICYNANEFRRNGYNVEIDMMNRKLKKSLDFANKEKIPYVVIVGEDELNNNQISIKDMFNNNNILLKLDKINQININNQTNSIDVSLDNYNVNILIRFKEVLNYQTTNFIKNDETRWAFVNLAGSEFNLFKNTIWLLTYYRDMNNLNQMRREFDYQAVDRPLFFVHAIRVLCSSNKDRSSDVLKNLVMKRIENQDLCEIPDFALDMHTRRGQEMGRDVYHFLNEASKVVPEMDVTNDYKERLKKYL